ncbi:protein NRT1/ PTR FAMILY 2.13-like [Malus domestica]|uniref:protein NRT1/ PTR FAMILY 2.13-like n=1 Tax=Malus domestica TaxID=3750 RepID=UPI0039771937
MGDKSNSFLSLCFRKRKCDSPSSKPLLQQKDEDLHQLLDPNTTKNKFGWKAMPYILGTESISTMATFGMTANFMVYLVREYHMEQVTAANIINIWICSYCLLSIVGASIADIYLGKFLTIAFASLATLTGMVTITLTALVPQLRPPPCILDDSLQCVSSATITQLGFLLAGLCWLGIGTGGIRPCSIPFGIDQFDSTTVEGRKSVGSYLNWYYTLSSLVLMINQTLVVYIQDSVSWSLGFGIPTLLMLCAIPLFLAGSKIYFYVKPEGSTFSSFAHVLVAAYKKRCLKLHNDERVRGVFFDASPKVDGKGNVVQSKLLLSTEFRFLKKAALVVDNEVSDDGSCANPWRLCSIQQVEEVICVVKTLPIWASGAIFLIAYAQEGTFVVSQALRMDRHIGLNFEMPAGSIKLMSMMTVIISLPLYNRVLQPAIRKITKHEDGLPALQRIGIGYFFSILCMMVAGLIEQRRRALATSQDSSNGIAAMSVFWLFPQQILLGLLEVFGTVGHIEFYNKEFPESMKSIGNSLPYLCLAGATYLSSVVVSIVHSVTGKHGQPNWLDNDINVGRLDNYYFLIAGLGVVNFLYFLSCARGYTYKASVKAVESVETNPIV